MNSFQDQRFYRGKKTETKDHLFWPHIMCANWNEKFFNTKSNTIMITYKIKTLLCLASFSFTKSKTSISYRYCTRSKKFLSNSKILMVWNRRSLYIVEHNTDSVGLVLSLARMMPRPIYVRLTAVYSSNIEFSIVLKNVY
jgi:hypothetical protein